MTQFLTGEIRGGDITKPRVYITGGSTAYKGKTVTCRAGNDLRGTKKVSVILIDDKILGKRFTAFSDKAQAHNPEIINQSITVKKQPKKPAVKVEVGASLKVLFVKQVNTGSFPFYTYSRVWLIGGDRENPLSVYSDPTGEYNFSGFNNMGFGDLFVGFLTRTEILDNSDSSRPSIDITTRRAYKDSPGTTATTLIDSYSSVSGTSSGETVAVYYSGFLRPQSPPIPTTIYNFFSRIYNSTSYASGGDTVTNAWSSTIQIDNDTNYVYRLSTNISDYIYHSFYLSRYDEAGSDSIIESNVSGFTFLILPDPDVYLSYPNGNGSSYRLIGFNDKKNTSFGLHHDNPTNTTEYRLYNRDLTFKSMPYDPNNPPELLTFESKNINWVDDKLYVADAWINDVNDEFYESGSYMGADMDSMGGNEPYPKWDAKTPVIIRVYEFKDHPTESDQFIIEQVDAFLFDAERITPPDYDYTDAGSDGRPPTHPENPLYYYPVALSYHPG